MKLETMFATASMFVVGALLVVFVAGAVGPRTPQARPAAASQSRPAPGEVRLVPADPVATRPPLSLTPAPDLPVGDAKRLEDLQAMASALQAYHQKKGAYPSTTDKLQTACVFQNLDKLCEIKNDVGADRMVDVRGSNFGYWYLSDGKTFTLFASLVGPPGGSDPCPSQVSVIRAPNVFCLNSHTN